MFSSEQKGLFDDDDDDECLISSSWWYLWESLSCGALYSSESSRSVQIRLVEHQHWPKKKFKDDIVYFSTAHLSFSNLYTMYNKKFLRKEIGILSRCQLTCLFVTFSDLYKGVLSVCFDSLSYLFWYQVWEFTSLLSFHKYFLTVKALTIFLLLLQTAE